MNETLDPSLGEQSSQHGSEQWQQPTVPYDHSPFPASRIEGAQSDTESANNDTPLPLNEDIPMMLDHPEPVRQGNRARLNLPGQNRKDRPTSARSVDRNRDRSTHSSYRQSGSMEESQRLANGKNRPPSLDLAALTMKAEELSKAVAAEVRSLMKNGNSRQEDMELELVIRTSIMSVLSPTGGKKRKSEETGTSDDPSQPNAKKVACRTCFKVVSRPCDLK
jgi:hypothetical protein